MKVTNKDLENDFENWVYSWKTSKIMIGNLPIPVLTELLYGICENNVEKFNTLNDYIKEAFVAGSRAQLKKQEKVMHKLTKRERYLVLLDRRISVDAVAKDRSDTDHWFQTLDAAKRYQKKMMRTAPTAGLFIIVERLMGD
jgi:hypothetical protein